LKSFFQYITEAQNTPKPPKPNVLIVSIPDVWDMNAQDLKPLKAVANVEWLQTKNLSQEKLAEKCRGYQHLMLNVDALASDPSQMERLDQRFYNHPGIHGLISLNQDMTDCDYFNPHMAIKKGLLLQDCPNTTTQSVAESTICEILLHTRKRHAAYTEEKNGGTAECHTGINLKGKTVGIIGYGNIGKAVATMLRGFGMNVLVNDTDLTVEAKITPLPELFKKSDVISVHIPTVEKTGESNVNLIGSDLLNLCKGAVLINLATDVIVDPAAAAAALRSKKLIGYSTQSDYSGEYGKKYLKKFKGIDEFHLSPCSFDSPESQKNIKRVWIQNTVSVINGTPENVWGNLNPK
jgi:phosphoglycerate dehydrogenase-like enzyme